MTSKIPPKTDTAPLALSHRPQEAPPRRIKLRHITPSLVTIFAICAGLTSVRMSMEGNLSAALYLVIFAVFLDGVDGKIARYLDAASPFGAELDSLADFFNFGIAPGILIYTSIYSGTPYENLGWLSCLVLAVCCALRLARFNLAMDVVEPGQEPDKYFVGVPAPALACLALMPTFLLLLGGTWLSQAGYAVAIYVIGIGLLAVSTLPTFSIKNASLRREWLPGFVVCAVVVVMCLLVYPWATLAVANLAYLASMPVTYTLARKQNARAQPSSSPR